MMASLMIRHDDGTYFVTTVWRATRREMNLTLAAWAPYIEEVLSLG